MARRSRSVTNTCADFLMTANPHTNTHNELLHADALEREEPESKKERKDSSTSVGIQTQPRFTGNRRLHVHCSMAPSLWDRSPTAESCDSRDQLWIIGHLSRKTANTRANRQLGSTYTKKGDTTKSGKGKGRGHAEDTQKMGTEKEKEKMGSKAQRTTIELREILFLISLLRSLLH